MGYGMSNEKHLRSMGLEVAARVTMNAQWVPEGIANGSDNLNLIDLL